MLNKSAPPPPESLRAPDDFLTLAVGNMPNNVAEFAEPMRYQDGLVAFSGEALRRVLNAAHMHGLPTQVYLSAPMLLTLATPAALESYTFYDGSITVDPVRRQILKDGDPVEMQRRDYLLAAYLGRRAGIPQSRSDLVRYVWGNQNPTVTEMKTVPVYITRIRKALGAGAIITRRNIGYVAAE